VNDKTVDPALFRLRRFQQERIGPLTISSATEPLSELLLAEAEAWLTIGIELGYFADQVQHIETSVDGHLTFTTSPIIRWIRSRSDPPDLTAAEFAQELSDAWESLTDERVELLRRLLFSNDQDWTRALSELDDFALALSTETEVSVSDLANLAWALDIDPTRQTDEKPSLTRTLPADWRADSLTQLSALVPHTAARIEGLERATRTIAQMLKDRYPPMSSELVATEPERFALDVREAAQAHARAALHAREFASPPEVSPARLVEYGTASAVAYIYRREWVHRSVEDVTCSTDDELLVRRQVRIDFTIPPGLEPIDPLAVGAGGKPEFYVPVSMMTKGTPAARFELRSASGELLPVLTRGQNATIDGALLLALAEQTTGSLPDSLREVVALIPRAEPQEASASLEALLTPSPDTDPSNTDARREARDDLRHNQEFARAARSLLGSTILWARVSGWPGERGVVEVSYELSTDLRLPWFSPEALSWRPLKVAIELPHIGEGPYHLDLEVPSSLVVTDARVSVFRSDSDHHMGRDDESRRPDSGPSISQFVARPRGRRASVEVAPTPSEEAIAWIGLLAEKSSIRIALLGSLLNTALLIAILAERHRIAVDGQTSVAAGAFLVPATFAAVASRAGRAPLAAALLGGVRLITGFALAISVVAAGSFVIAGPRFSTTFNALWVSLMLLSFLASVLLLASAALPIRRWRRLRRVVDEVDIPVRPPYWDVVTGDLKDVHA
jgi:hypothetical protein